MFLIPISKIVFTVNGKKCQIMKKIDESMKKICDFKKSVSVFFKMFSKLSYLKEKWEMGVWTVIYRVGKILFFLPHDDCTSTQLLLQLVPPNGLRIVRSWYSCFFVISLSLLSSTSRVNLQDLARQDSPREPCEYFQFWGFIFTYENQREPAPDISP